MQDRILYGSMRVTILSLITFLAGVTCVLVYQALLSSFGGELEAAVGKFIAAGGLAAGAGLLIRYRGELIDERHRRQ